MRLLLASILILSVTVPMFAQDVPTDFHGSAVVYVKDAQDGHICVYVGRGRAQSKVQVGPMTAYRYTFESTSPIGQSCLVDRYTVSVTRCYAASSGKVIWDSPGFGTFELWPDSSDIRGNFMKATNEAPNYGFDEHHHAHRYEVVSTRTGFTVTVFEVIPLPN